MLNTPDNPKPHHESDRLIDKKSKHLVHLRFVLVGLVMIVTFAGITSRNASNTKVFATDSSAANNTTPVPQASPSYLQYVAWPPGFHIKFAANYLIKGQRPVSLAGNELFYQAAENM
ncbi:MAG TPA: hypothetical protein VMS31_22660 [Pyrinomonadaceae bacterium]|nr:hypothetical protein [Pyrinomonadaceae bacterium]